MIELGISGFSGSGKTALVKRLIPELIGRGLKVSTIKHTHHRVSVDRRDGPGRRLSRAGMAEVLLVSPRRWALLRELHGALEPRVPDLTARLTPVDIVLVEGFKRHGHEKIEVYRQALGKPRLWPDDPRVIAVASDSDIQDLNLPLLDLNNTAAVADFILQRYPQLIRPQLNRPRARSARQAAPSSEPIGCDPEP